MSASGQTINYDLPMTWRAVDGFDGRYEVSDDGRCRNTQTGRELRGSPTRTGHVQLWFRTPDGTWTWPYLHRLVLAAFVGPCPEGQEGMHADDDPANNALSNLSWGTRSENVTTSVRHGRWASSRKTHCPSGHPYDDENTVMRPDPRGSGSYRACRICARERSREYRKRKRT